MQGDTQKSVSAVAELLGRPETIVFAGAGLSIWSGAPNWYDLVSRLVEYVEQRTGNSQQTARRALAQYQLMEAAEYVADRLKPNELSHFLREELRLSYLEPHVIHRLLVTLGPSCFVTTNFDKLIERQFSIANGRPLRVVSNRQLADMADIYRADARSFIFKPHGDVDDAESIVLTESSFNKVIAGTREDSYRGVASTLGLLLATRPILFIGYSISDLDLRLVLTKLQGAFDKHAGEYWAILADVPEEKRKSLWDNYRIRVLSYETKPALLRESRDHTALLDIVRALHDARNGKPASVPTSDGTKFNLARYGTRLAASKKNLPTTTKAYLNRQQQDAFVPREALEFHLESVSKILRDYQHSLILAGSAGYGKTFSIHQYIGLLGAELRDWSLAHQSGEPPTIPILVDARLYDGSFAHLVTTAVPSEVLAAIKASGLSITLAIDSLDEMPNQYLESGGWTKDLAEWLQQFHKSRLIYCTRRSDLVPDRHLAIFSLRPQTEGEIKKALAEAGLSSELLNPDSELLLSTPYMLRLATEHLDRDATQVTADGLFLSTLRKAIGVGPLRKRFADILSVLEELAFDANLLGRDTLSIESVEHSLTKSAGPSEDGSRYVDTLVSSGIFVSEIDKHVRFVHRSLLEYLAARKLGRELSLRPDVDKYLSSRRWDNCFAWCSSLIARRALRKILAAVCKIDACLALKVARTAEVNRAPVLSSVLDAISAMPLDFDSMLSISREIGDTQFATENAPSLRRLTKKRNALGGSAAAQIVKLGFKKDARFWIEEVCAGRVDYNMGSELGPSLGKTMSGEILEYFQEKLSSSKLSVREQEFVTEKGKQQELVLHSVAQIVACMSAVDRAALRSWSESQSASIRSAICEGLHDTSSKDEIAYMIRCWEARVPRVGFWLYLMARGDEGAEVRRQLSVTDERLRLFQKNLSANRRDHSFIEEFLFELCKQSSDWSKAVSKAALAQSDSDLRRIYRLCSTLNHKKEARALIRDLASGNYTRSEGVRRSVRLLEASDYRASVQDTLDILASDDSEVVEIVAEALSNPWGTLSDDALPADHVEVLLKALARWCRKGIARHEMVIDRLARVIISSLGPATLSTIIARANDPNDDDREVILTEIICGMGSAMLSSTELSAETSRTLLRLYINRPFPMFGRSPGQFATERFVEEFVLPLVEEQELKAAQQMALNQILIDAGNRHGRRYLANWKGGRRFVQP